ncbi:MAG: hypothetical protein KJ858_03575 [Nanoarchaeota archaeon]|nr:hypothetical protein [Nanoarchaeota archaeon]
MKKRAKKKIRIIFSLILLSMSFLFLILASFYYLKFQTNLIPGVLDLIGEKDQTLNKNLIYLWLFGIILFGVYLLSLENKDLQKDFIKSIFVYLMEVIITITTALILLFLFVPNFTPVFKITLFLSGLIIFYVSYTLRKFINAL